MKYFLPFTLILIVLITDTEAQSGTLDLSFGNNGIVITDFNNTYDKAYSIALQSDGKIVVGGTAGVDFGLARYNSDGSLDNTFGIGGKVITDFDNKDQNLNDIKMQQDGKIVAAGMILNEKGDFLLVRYNTDGTIDNTFGDNGKVITSFVESDETNSIVLQPDGKIIAAGYTYVSTKREFAVARYNTDGTLDQTFSDDGKVTTYLEYNSTPYDSKALCVDIQSDGKIVAGGFVLSPKGQTDFALVRYNSDGSLDTSITMI